MIACWRTKAGRVFCEAIALRQSYVPCISSICFSLADDVLINDGSCDAAPTTTLYTSSGTTVSILGLLIAKKFASQAVTCAQVRDYSFCGHCPSDKMSLLFKESQFKHNVNALKLNECALQDASVTEITRTRDIGHTVGKLIGILVSDDIYFLNKLGSIIFWGQWRNTLHIG